MTSTIDRPTDQPRIDILDGRLYDDPWETYRWLRDEAPCYWDDKNQLWVISRHADVSAISRNPELYCSRFGVRPAVAAPMSIVSMDDPEHTRQRRLINKGFTPRQVRRLAPHIRALSDQIIDEIQHRGEVEFVSEFAIHVPLIVIAELLGLDPEGRQKLYRWSDAMMAGDGHVDPDSPKLQAAAVAFGEYVEHLVPIIEARRSDPGEDLISILTGAHDAGGLDAGEHMAVEVDDDQLTSDELFMFLCILIVAGNETTRNAISGGLAAFSRFPDQKERLLADMGDEGLWDLAADEIVRYVSPVLSFTRTVTADHELHGQRLQEGDRVLLLYQSANRDERVFDAPDELRVDRDPNPHLGFGIGPHFCLGANLARLEIKTVFQQLFQRLADIRVAEGAELRRADHTLVLAIEHLPAVFTPVATG